MHDRDRKLRNEMFPQWQKLAEDLFPVSVPEMARWTELDDIVKVLKRIGESCGKINHIFFPDGGGMDLTGARRSAEPGCVELMADDVPYICNPKELIFFAVEDSPDWMGFWLESSPLRETGVYGEVRGRKETVREVSPGIYAHRNAPSGRLVTRYFEGSFVIFCKASWYNFIKWDGFDAYDAYHTQYTPETFMAFLRQFAELGKRPAF